MDWRRMQKLAADAAGNGEQATDARPSFDDPHEAVRDPDACRRRRFHRRATAVTIGAVFMACSLVMLFGKGGYVELRRLRQERDELSRLVAERESRIEAQREDVDRLKHDPLARERIAREDLGYAKPGEVTIILPREEAETEVP